MKLLLVSLISVLALNNYAQNVNIPDANFKAYLVGNSTINANGDTEIQVSEAVVYSGSIICTGLNISDLTGIEEFTALTDLSIGFNQLMSMDVSQNTDLTYLRCDNNPLTSLDVTQNTGLTYLNCAGNELTSLNLTQNTALTYLSCSYSQLTNLDLTQNTALTELSCAYSQLASLDVAQNASLVYLNCRDNQLTCLNVKNANNTNFSGFYADANPNITCIEVDDVAYSNANWTDIDAQTSFSTACSSPCAVGLNELSNSPKQLIKIVDLIGRETTFKSNTSLIYIYSDGTAEKVFKLD